MRILMLGNSLTRSNHMPDMLAELLDAEVVANVRSGARLAEQLNVATHLGSQVSRFLQEEPFDYVVLQEMSHGPATATDRYLESVGRLADAARRAGAVPMIYATWAFHPSCEKLQKLGMDSMLMHEQMQVAFAKAAEVNQMPVANVGEAFRQRGFADELYAPDGRHPSAAGSKLAAEVIARAIREHQQSCATQA